MMVQGSVCLPVGFVCIWLLLWMDLLSRPPPPVCDPLSATHTYTYTLCLVSHSPLHSSHNACRAGAPTTECCYRHTVIRTVFGVYCLFGCWDVSLACPRGWLLAVVYLLSATSLNIYMQQAHSFRVVGVGGQTGSVLEWYA